MGVPLTDDIEEMARVARQALREKFLTADLGISGANFLVAETGTLVIITNEGNGRLCTSAPRIHIGITGMEKVIPSMQDLTLFLRLLPRSAHRPTPDQLRQHGYRPPPGPMTRTAPRNFTLSWSTMAAPDCWPTRRCAKLCTASAAARA